jgi:hypothetical protein
VRDGEGHRKIPADRVTDQVNALSFDAFDKVQNPVGSGAAIVEAAVVDPIAQPASGTVRDDHISGEQARQRQPVTGVGQAAVNKHGRAWAVTTADHVGAPPVTIDSPAARAHETTPLEVFETFMLE